MELPPLELEDGLQKLAKESGRKLTRLKEQLKYFKNENIVEEPISDMVPDSNDILKEQSNEQEIESYSKGVNWIDDEYLKKFLEEVKSKNISTS